MNNEYDVIVVGVGTAGSIAVYNMAKLGLRVLGIERFNSMGGVGTLGGIQSYYFGSNGGTFEKINSETVEFQKKFNISTTSPNFNLKSYILENKIRKLNVDILYETIVTDVLMKDNKVVGVVCYRNGKKTSFFSKFVIDCTGEADVCNMCGVKTAMGRTFDGQTQPFTNLIFKANDDVLESLNRDAGFVNQYDNKELSKAIIDSLTVPSLLLDDYSNELNFVSNASLLGIREGRTIVAEENISLANIFNNQKVEKPIFYAYSNIDNHGKDTVFEDDILKDWYVGAGLWGVSFSVAVPMGAVIPKNYDGLLVAGRCLGVDHNIASLVRMKSDMEKCGEAAAVLTYLAIRDGVPAKDANYNEMAEMLRQTGCLDIANDIGFHMKTSSGMMPFSWITDTNELKNGLASEFPGIAIWSAKLLGDTIVNDLINWSLEDDDSLKLHSSIALGLLGRKEGLPILRKIAQKRVCKLLDANARFVYTIGTTAIYLLGKLKDEDSVSILIEILKDCGEFDRSKFTPSHLYTTEEDVKFHFYSYAIISIIEIGNKNPQLKSNINSILKEFIVNKDQKILLSMKADATNTYDIYPKIKNYVKSAII